MNKQTNKSNAKSEAEREIMLHYTPEMLKLHKELKDKFNYDTVWTPASELIFAIKHHPDEFYNLALKFAKLVEERVEMMGDRT